MGAHGSSPGGDDDDDSLEETPEREPSLNAYMRQPLDAARVGTWDPPENFISATRAAAPVPAPPAPPAPPDLFADAAAAAFASFTFNNGGALARAALEPAAAQAPAAPNPGSSIGQASSTSPAAAVASQPAQPASSCAFCLEATGAGRALFTGAHESSSAKSLFQFPQCPAQIVRGNHKYLGRRDPALNGSSFCPPPLDNHPLPPSDRSLRDSAHAGPCGHSSHLECILRAARFGLDACPLCRAPLDLRGPGVPSLWSPPASQTLDPSSGQPSNHQPGGGGLFGTNNNIRRSDLFGPPGPLFGFGLAAPAGGLFRRGQAPPPPPAPRRRQQQQQQQQQQPPSPSPRRNSSVPGAAAYSEAPRDLFDDDEERPPAAAASTTASAAATDSGTLSMTLVPETPELALPAPGSSADPVKFSALVTLRAPPPPAAASGSASATGGGRAPLDLVAVLDVSGSMSGAKLGLVKRTMELVASSLGPRDRLAVVSFNSHARRVTRLRCMSEAGRAATRSAIESLKADGGTSVVGGIVLAARLLSERRHGAGGPAEGLTSAVLLLTDGCDEGGPSCDETETGRRGLAALRASGAGLYTFGFGSDHEPGLLRRLAERGRGTFTFVEEIATIRSAFALVLGGLLSVTVASLALEITPGTGVRVTAVHAGTRAAAGPGPGQHTIAELGPLFGDEARDILLDLAVGPPPGPPLGGPGQGQGPAAAQLLVTVRATYTGGGAASSAGVRLEAAQLVVARPAPGRATLEGATPNVAVGQQRARVAVASALAEACAAADAGELAAARDSLAAAQAAVEAGSAAGTPFVRALVGDLQAATSRLQVRSTQEYATSGGSAFMMSSALSHQQQRSVTTTVTMTGPPSASYTLYATPRQHMAVEASTAMCCLGVA